MRDPEPEDDPPEIPNTIDPGFVNRMERSPVFKVTMAPESPGLAPLIFYVKAESAADAADKAERVTLSERKSKLHVGSLKRLGYLVE
jgi:hypothetical protein